MLYLQEPQKGSYYSAIGQIDDAGTSNYNGMLLSVQRRASGGVTFKAITRGRIASATTWCPGSGIVPARRIRADEGLIVETVEATGS